MSIDALVSSVSSPHRCRFACHCLERAQITPRFGSQTGSTSSQINQIILDQNNPFNRTLTSPHPNDMTIIRGLAQLRKEEAENLKRNPPPCSRNRSTVINTTSTSTTNAFVFPLLSLPFEIRQIVLRYVLTSPSPITFIYIRQQGRLKLPSPCPNQLSPAILRTCSQLLAEGTPFLYEGNTIELTHTTALTPISSSSSWWSNADHRPRVSLPKRWYECDNPWMGRFYSSVLPSPTTTTSSSSSSSSGSRNYKPRLFWHRITHLRLTIRTTFLNLYGGGHGFFGPANTTPTAARYSERTINEMYRSVEKLTWYVKRDAAQLRGLTIDIIREGNWRITGGGDLRAEEVEDVLKIVLEPLTELKLDPAAGIEVNILTGNKNIRKWLMDMIFKKKGVEEKAKEDEGEGFSVVVEGN